MNLDKAIQLGILTKTRWKFADDIWRRFIAIPVTKFEDLKVGRDYWGRVSYASYGQPGRVYRVTKTTEKKKKVTLNPVEYFDGELRGEVRPFGVYLSTSMQFREVDMEILAAFWISEEAYGEMLKEAYDRGLYLSDEVKSENIHLFHADCPRDKNPKQFDFYKGFSLKELNSEIEETKTKLEILKWLSSREP